MAGDQVKHSVGVRNMDKGFLIIAIVSVAVIVVTPAQVDFLVRPHQGDQRCAVFCGIAALPRLAGGEKIILYQYAAIEIFRQIEADILAPREQHRPGEKFRLFCYQKRLDKELTVRVRLHLVEKVRLGRCKARFAITQSPH